MHTVGPRVSHVLLETEVALAATFKPGERVELVSDTSVTFSAGSRGVVVAAPDAAPGCVVVQLAGWRQAFWVSSLRRIAN